MKYVREKRGREKGKVEEEKRRRWLKKRGKEVKEGDEFELMKTAESKRGKERKGREWGGDVKASTLALSSLLSYLPFLLSSFSLPFFSLLFHPLKMNSPSHHLFLLQLPYFISPLSLSLPFVSILIPFPFTSVSPSPSLLLFSLFHPFPSLLLNAFLHSRRRRWSQLLGGSVSPTKNT